MVTAAIDHLHEVDRSTDEDLGTSSVGAHPWNWCGSAGTSSEGYDPTLVNVPTWIVRDLPNQPVGVSEMSVEAIKLRGFLGRFENRSAEARSRCQDLRDFLITTDVQRNGESRRRVDGRRLRRDIRREASCVVQPENHPWADLKEDDLVGYIKRRSPSKAVDVEGVRRIEISGRNRDETDRLIHAPNIPFPMPLIETTASEARWGDLGR